MLTFKPSRDKCRKSVKDEEHQHSKAQDLKSLSLLKLTAIPLPWISVMSDN